MVILDRFTKYRHFVSLRHPFTTQNAARLYIDSVHRLHGVPQVLVSNRDKLFTSIFWRELLKLLETQLYFSLAYRSQTNDQTERLNQCLEMFVWCMAHQQSQSWNKWLPLAEWWYNTTYHLSLEMTPVLGLVRVYSTTF